VLAAVAAITREEETDGDGNGSHDGARHEQPDRGARESADRAPDEPPDRGTRSAGEPSTAAARSGGG
jgi:hypothetical protein